MTPLLSASAIEAGLIRQGVPPEKARAVAFWTAERDAVLAARYLTTSHADIAAEIGSTESAVRSRCSLLGLKKNRWWTAADRATVREWYTDRQGRPLEIARLAAMLGRSKHHVSNLAKTMGLTSRTRPKPAGYGGGASVRAAAAIREHGHPRGMLGKHHSPETRARLSAFHRGRPQQISEEQRQLRSDLLAARHAAGTVTPSSNAYSRCKSGRREDLAGQFFRSSWEANYARYLNWLIERGAVISWEYEAETFWFERIRRGVRSYTPDFKVTDVGGAIHFDEIKGWMDAKSRTKIARMKKYHPGVDLRVIDATAYKEIARKLGGALPGWEWRVKDTA